MNFKKLKNLFFNLNIKQSNLIDKADYLLVSYPKSGNTWVRFLLTSYLTNKPATFHDIAIIIPDDHMVSTYKNNNKRPSIVKTHKILLTEIKKKKIIYLIRDGRDVAVSYYHYLMKVRQIDEKTNFKSFLKLFNEGRIDTFGHWGAHTEYYFFNKCHNILFVKYEDLLVQTDTELQRILAFCNIEWNEERAKKAIRNSSFKKMQMLDETEHNLMNHMKAARTDIPFVRVGKQKQYMNYFDQSESELFNKRHNNMLISLNYI